MSCLLVNVLLLIDKSSRGTSSCWRQDATLILKLCPAKLEGRRTQKLRWSQPVCPIPGIGRSYARRCSDVCASLPQGRRAERPGAGAADGHCQQPAHLQGEGFRLEAPAAITQCMVLDWPTM